MRKLCFFLFLALAACGSDSSSGFNGGPPDGAGGGDGGDGNDGGTGFHGGDGGGSPDGGACVPNLFATIRDFKPCVAAQGDNDSDTQTKCHNDLNAGKNFGHPDFEDYVPCDGAVTGIVDQFLDANHKPVWNSFGLCHGQDSQRQTTSKEAFAQWYTLVPGADAGSNNASSNIEFFNVPMPVEEVEGQRGRFRFPRKGDPQSFFPVDNKGWMNQPTFKNGTTPHNFAFTTEMNVTFVYHPSEIFSFNGDDDLWVFIEGELALDIGGIHPKTQGTLNLGDFAKKHPLTDGKTYRMDLFGAERHTVESNFTFETTMECAQSIPIH